jgi:hypothetical protein
LESRVSVGARFQRLVEQGWPAVIAYVNDRTAEGLHLDFKRSADNGRGAALAPPTLADEDQRNIARSVTAFANTDGGIVVFGIKTSREDDGDRAVQVVPLVNCSAFANLVRLRLDHACDPTVPGVRVEAIPDGSGTGAGAVAILIPSSTCGPHKARGKGATDFYMRTELGVAAMPHSLLAALFGRRPTPRLAVRIVRTELGRVGIWVENSGPGSARSPYVRIEARVGGRHAGVDVVAQSDGWYRQDARRFDGTTSLNFYLNHERVLYPRHSMHVVELAATESGSLTGMTISGFVVSDGASPIEYEAVVPTQHEGRLTGSADA